MARDNRPLQGQVALITGASSGIGEALAMELASRGVFLVLAARREDKLQEIAMRARKLGTRVAVVACDVTLSPQLEGAVLAAVSAFGHLDIVVANAGFGVTGPFQELKNSDFRRQFDTNVFGVLRTIRACLPPIERRAGQIWIMGSVSSYVSVPGDSPYSMSKAAVRALADSLYLELKPRGVHVGLICPGFVESEIRQKDNEGNLREHAKDPIPSWLVVSRATAAREIADSIATRRREVIVTGHGRWLVRFRRWLPELMMRILAHYGDALMNKRSRL